MKTLNTYSHFRTLLLSSSLVISSTYKHTHVVPEPVPSTWPCEAGFPVPTAAGSQAREVRLFPVYLDCCTTGPAHQPGPQLK